MLGLVDTSLLAGLTLIVAGCGSEPRGAGEAGPATTPDPAPEASGDARDNNKLRILVTNDDGVLGEGLNALVAELIQNPDNDVIVSAPLVNQSGSGDKASCSTSRAFKAVSGAPQTWAIDGCPADAVNYALDNIYSPEAPPHVILSGINAGQNIGEVTECGLLSQQSGTVGAAKTGARRGVPALASSQGIGTTGCAPDFASGVDVVVSWLEAHRDALLNGELSPTTPDTPAPVFSINIPTCCDSGSLKAGGDPITVELATQGDDLCELLTSQDCSAGSTDPATYAYDVEAFVDGWVTLVSISTDGHTTPCASQIRAQLGACRAKPSD